MSLGEIIRNRREEMGLTLDEVSAKVGFSKPYLSTIETGRVRNPPSDELLWKLEQVLKFDTGVLIHIAHMERAPTDVKEKVESTEADNERLREIIREMASGKLDAAGARKAIEGEGRNISFSAGRLVPVINKVSAGYPTDFDEMNYPIGVADDYIRCPDMHDPNTFAVRVVGDSMEPKFKEGDFVVFSPAAQVVSGDDCFVRFSSPHETTFKRVFFEENDTIRLQPRNDKYPPVIVEGKRINRTYRAIVKVTKV